MAKTLAILALTIAILFCGVAGKRNDRSRQKELDDAKNYDEPEVQPHRPERLPTKPRLDGPRNQTAFVGATAKFKCHVTSDPQPSLQWLKHYQVNGSYKSEDGMPYIEVLEQSNTTDTEPEWLVLDNVTFKDAGWYTCLATNYIGMAYNSAWLTILPVPKKEVHINMMYVYFCVTGGLLLLIVIVIAVLVKKRCCDQCCSQDQATQDQDQDQDLIGQDQDQGSETKTRRPRPRPRPDRSRPRPGVRDQDQDLIGQDHDQGSETKTKT